LQDTRDTEGDARDAEGDARDGAAARSRQTPSALSGQSPGVFSERRWSFVAGACLVAAIALLVVAGIEAAFVPAVLGVVAWFWDQRNRIRATIIEDERADERRDEPGEFDDDADGRDGGGRRSDEARGGTDRGSG